MKLAKVFVIRHHHHHHGEMILSWVVDSYTTRLLKWIIDYGDSSQCRGYFNTWT